LILKFGTSAHPWWWQEVAGTTLPCKLEYELIPLEGGRPASPLTPGFWRLAARATRVLRRARNEGYRYVFTIEGDWLTFIIAGLQTLRLLRQPRHVVLQFVMRERVPGLRSGLKFALLRWWLSSVHLFVCPSRSELDGYAAAFHYPKEKFAFVASPTNQVLLDRPRLPEAPIVVSAGRTFRDYATLLKAVAGTDLNVTIVAGQDSLREATIPANVTVHYNLPAHELTDLIARSMIVVVTLEERHISAGHSVLLEAMALGKPVIVTRVTGTVDYVDDMTTGILVPPGDVDRLREAMMRLSGDARLRRCLGDAGREQVRKHHLPGRFAREVSRVLTRCGTLMALASVPL
jgi:glycosyltransferase involved in cell wall biosynthesis